MVILVLSIFVVSIAATRTVGASDDPKSSGRKAPEDPPNDFRSGTSKLQVALVLRRMFNAARRLAADVWSNPRINACGAVFRRVTKRDGGWDSSLRALPGQSAYLVVTKSRSMHQDNKSQTISDHSPYQFPGKWHKSDRCNDRDETAWCQSGALEARGLIGAPRGSRRSREIIPEDNSGG